MLSIIVFVVLLLNSSLYGRLVDSRLDIENTISYQGYNSDGLMLSESIFYEVDFESRYERGGYITSVRKDLGRFINGAYVSLRVPVVVDEHSTIICTGDCRDGIPKWGKFEKEVEIRVLLDDIDLVKGFDFEFGEHKIGVNVGVTIPLEHKYKASMKRDSKQYEKIISYKNGFGIGGGGNLKLNLWKGNEKLLDATCAVDFRYFFKHTGFFVLRDTRFFDLDSFENLPLIYKTDISSVSNIEALLGLRCQMNGLIVDLGYLANVKDREEETTRPLGDFESNLEDIDWNEIFRKDPLHIIHKAYLSVGYVFGEEKHPVTLGLGATYELFDNDKSYYDQAGLGVWGKVALNF